MLDHARYIWLYILHAEASSLCSSLSAVLCIDLTINVIKQIIVSVNTIKTTCMRQKRYVKIQDLHNSSISTDTHPHVTVA